MVNMEHFETIWQQAEETSKGSFISRVDIYCSIKNIIDEYERLDKIPAPEIQKILRTKKFGELLYKVAELSRIDGVNTFSALKQETAINQR